MKKLILILILFMPLCASAQFRFVIHPPFSGGGDPLFCCEPGCVRKAKLAKRMKKTKHKREVQARKLRRNKEAQEVYVKNSPVQPQPHNQEGDKSKSVR